MLMKTQYPVCGFALYPVMCMKISALWLCSAISLKNKALLGLKASASSPTKEQFQP